MKIEMKEIKNKGKLVNLTEKEFKAINALGVDFSAKTREMGKSYLKSAAMGIDELRKDISSLKTELALKELMLSDKLKAIERRKSANIEAESMELVGAYFLRFFNVRNGSFKVWNAVSGKTELNTGDFTMSRSELEKFRADVQNGILTPDSPLRDWARYKLIVRNEHSIKNALEKIKEELEAQS